MIPIIDTVVAGVTKVIDKIVPDANVREQIKAEIQKDRLEWERLDVADRDSARKREMEVKDTTPRNLALLITLALLGGAIWFTINPPTEANRTLVEMFGSALRDGWIMMVAYYFGASHAMRGESWKA